MRRSTPKRCRTGPLLDLASAASFAVGARSDAELREAAHRAGLALSVDELRRIAQRLGRDPTVVEVYAFDAQWSEHCSYKSTRHHLRKLPTDGPTVMQGPQEDAGIVHLGEWNGERYGIVIAHESHNHPSQVVPYEGAATGVGGIVRDVLCMGATVIAVADPLRFGDLGVAHSRYVAQGVVDGVAAYGNAIGVPNIAGDVYFDPAFDENALVNVVALGLVKEGEIIHSRAPEGSVGWDIVLIGKATDRSGFGGASFSSLTLDAEDAEANKGAVQVPDPFLKNVIMRATYCVFALLRSQGIEAGFKDLGAGGIVGCTAELVASGGYGAVVDLDRAPTAQPNLPPAVVAIGETQERLCWILPPSITPQVLAVYNDMFGLPLVSRGARAAVIGKVAESNEYVLRWEGRELMRVPLDFLTGGVRYDRAAAELPATPEPEGPMAVDVADVIELVLGHHDVCSRQPIFSRYDGVVRGTTAIPPGYADAGVIVPIPGAPLACALAVDGNPRYGKLDPRRAAELAVCESVRNVVAVGARPAGLTDCLNFGNPERPEIMAQLVEAIEGISEACRFFETPITGGNVSLYNETLGESIWPTPVMGIVGLMKTAPPVTIPFKNEDRNILLLGGWGSPEDFNPVRFGGTQYAKAVLNNMWGLPPALHMDYEKRVQAAVREIIEASLAESSHDVSDGGLAVALAECSMGGIGADVTIQTGLRGEIALFHEGASRILVSTANLGAVEEIASRHHIACERIGVTMKERLRIGHHSATWVDSPVDRLREVWENALEELLTPAYAQP